MTNYNLPETDRIAEYVNPVFDEVAKMDERDATLVEVGALTIIGLLDESIADMRKQVLALAAEQGVTVTEADFHFQSVIDHLFNIFKPRMRTLAAAVATAQAPEPEPEPEDDPTALIEGLLVALVGEEAAAQIIAEVEEEIAAEAEEAAHEYDEDDEDDEVEDVEWSEEDDAAMQREFDEFLQALFGRRP